MVIEIQKSEKLKAITHSVPVLNPAEAEIHFHFHLDEAATDVELRGRLTGPRCPYATTVEIAYPLRPLPKQAGTSHIVTGRIVIPEPSLWDPVSPYLYEGPLEVWIGGQPKIRVVAHEGLRKFQFSTKGLRWNSQLLPLWGSARFPHDEIQARQLRALGCNTLLAPPYDKETHARYMLADRFGFLVLMPVTEMAQLAMVRAVAEGFVSGLGWIVPQHLLADPVDRERVIGYFSHLNHLLGVQIETPATYEDFPEAAFVYCGEEMLPQLEHSAKPKLIYIKEPQQRTFTHQENILGYVSDFQATPPSPPSEGGDGGVAFPA